MSGRWSKRREHQRGGRCAEQEADMMIVCIRVKSDRKVMLMYDLTIKSWRTMISGCLCVCGDCHSETTCNIHSRMYWKTHSHTLKPTHLSGGFEIELGLGTNTPNNYPSLLRLVIHFAWIYFSLFHDLAPSIILPLLLLCSTFHILTSLFSPPSQVMVSFPWALRQNVTIQQSCFWLMAADACHIMSTLWLRLFASGTLYPMNAIFLILLQWWNMSSSNCWCVKKRKTYL